MTPKPIGIVGGAGPFAGLNLLNRLFSLAQTKYGCVDDKDFPLVILYSFPFSDMLSEKRDEGRVREELSRTIGNLRAAGAELVAIACNTLHAFLSEEKGLIRMPLNYEGTPMVFCTSTSRSQGVHKGGEYPDLQTQLEVDDIIRRILKGENCLCDVQALIDRQNKPVVLGCTELSLYAEELRGNLIDPLKLLAEKLLNESFTV